MELWSNTEPGQKILYYGEPRAQLAIPAGGCGGATLGLGLHTKPGRTTLYVGEESARSLPYLHGAVVVRSLLGKRYITVRRTRAHAAWSHTGAAVELYLSLIHI